MCHFVKQMERSFFSAEKTVQDSHYSKSLQLVGLDHRLKISYTSGIAILSFLGVVQIFKGRGSGWVDR